MLASLPEQHQRDQKDKASIERSMFPVTDTQRTKTSETRWIVGGGSHWDLRFVLPLLSTAEVRNATISHS